MPKGAAAFPNAEVNRAGSRDCLVGAMPPMKRAAQKANAPPSPIVRGACPYAARLRRIGPDAEVIPASAPSLPMAIRPVTCHHIADGADQMMFVADTTNRPELLARRPDFHIVFDFDAVAAEATRRRIFDRVATDRIRITGYHFPFPANGYLAKEGNGYRSLSRRIGRAWSDMRSDVKLSPQPQRPFSLGLVKVKPADMVFTS
jgi:hypothetical protein